MSTPAQIARHAATLSDVEWYDFLDEIDEAVRERQQSPLPEPDGSDLNAAVAWIARTYFIADNKAREIWYLPSGAPTDQIRLIQINDRFEVGGLEPFDTAIRVGGHQYKVLTIDTTTEEFESFRQDSSLLPKGWTLDGAKVWRRRA